MPWGDMKMRLRISSEPIFNGVNRCLNWDMLTPRNIVFLLAITIKSAESNSFYVFCIVR